MPAYLRNLLALSLLFIFNFSIAGELKTTCKTTGPIVGFDYNYFKLTRHSNEYTNWYTYLSDSVLLKYINTEKTRARFFSIDLVLLEENKLVINYVESNAYSEDGACWAHYDEVFKDIVEATWNSANDKLSINGFGEGKAILCNNKPALSFVYSKNIGPSEIKQKEYVLTYGRSNISPIKKTLAHPCP